MKRITIGRNPNCDIVFDQNMVSRNHALLNIYPSGKYEIVSMGTNGTKVNGTLISNGQPYPLKRGDAVIFAGQCHLDWKDVPNPSKPWKLSIIIAGAVIALGLLAWGIVWAANHDWSGSFDNGHDDSEQEEFIESMPTDSLSNDAAKPDSTVVETDSAATRPSSTRRFFPSTRNDNGARPGKKKPAPAPADETTAQPETKTTGNGDSSTSGSEDGWHR